MSMDVDESAFVDSGNPYISGYDSDECEEAIDDDDLPDSFGDEEDRYLSEEEFDKVSEDEDGDTKMAETDFEGFTDSELGDETNFEGFSDSEYGDKIDF